MQFYNLYIYICIVQINGENFPSIVKKEIHIGGRQQIIIARIHLSYESFTLRYHYIIQAKLLAIDNFFKMNQGEPVPPILILMNQFCSCKSHIENPKKYWVLIVSIVIIWTYIFLLSLQLMDFV